MAFATTVIILSLAREWTFLWQPSAEKREKPMKIKDFFIKLWQSSKKRRKFMNSLSFKPDLQLIVWQASIKFLSPTDRWQASINPFCAWAYIYFPYKRNVKAAKALGYRARAASFDQLDVQKCCTGIRPLQTEETL